MRIHVVNPNTTRSMTDKIVAAARAVAGPGVDILPGHPAMGPVSIEGYYDQAFAIPGMLACVRDAEGEGVAGHVIACFDDTGLDAARSVCTTPVIGIGEAAYHIASLVAGRFSVITTLSRSIPALEHNLHRYGLSVRCARVRAAEVEVLALEDPSSGAAARVSDEIAAAIVEDRAEAIVLGCAGMADLAAGLSKQHGLPVIDGVASAIALIEALARVGARTSKLGGYAMPLKKAYTGTFAGFAP